MLELLTRAGYTPEKALHIYRSYWGLLHGHILNELQEVVVDPEATDTLLRLGLDRLSEQEFPQLRRLAPVLLAGYDGAAALDESLDLLLDGLHAAVAQPAKDRRRRRPERSTGRG